jgi:hypothetical protein
MWSKSEWVRTSHAHVGVYLSLCVFFLLDERVEGKVYGFRVKDVEITKVAEKAGITEVAKMAKMTEGVWGIWITARHVIWPVAKMAKASIKTARHVM